MLAVDRLDQLDQRLDGLANELRAGFAELDGRLDEIVAGRQHIVDLLNGPDRPGDLRRGQRPAHHRAAPRAH